MTYGKSVLILTAGSALCLLMNIALGHFHGITGWASSTLLGIILYLEKKEADN